MSNTGVQPNVSAKTSHFSAAHPNALSAYSHGESFPTTASAADQHIDHNNSSAKSRTLTQDKFLIDPGVESRERKGNGTKPADAAKTQKALHHIIRQFEKSTRNIPTAWNDPKVVWVVCKSKRKPDILDICDGHVSVVDRLWKNYNETAQAVSGRTNNWGDGGREGTNGRGKDGNEKEGINRFVPRDWKYVQYVSEFEVKEYKRKLRECSPIVRLEEEIDDLLKDNSFGWGTTFFNEMFKLDNRICSAIVMELLVPLRCAKNAAHFKQAIRDVVHAHHIAFARELRIPRRDISVDSLMFRYCDANTLYGVLIDFDLAVVFSGIIEDHMGMRTRSRPFMAWELLESDPPPIHLERFDWESFFYVICWIGCRYSEGKEVNNSILSGWYNPNDELLVFVKCRWLQEPVGFTSFYISVARDWVIDLMAIFQEGMEKKAAFRVAKSLARPEDPINDEEFDEETSGGPVTWDRFWGVLQK